MTKMTDTKIVEEEKGLQYFFKSLGNALSRIMKKGDYRSGYWDGIRIGIIIGFLVGIFL